MTTPTPITPPNSTENNAKKTSPSWSGPEDARKLKGAGTYPNYHEFKTRSGHNLIYDDSNGAESITLQHRTGSMIQMMPDGAVQIVTHNGQYNIVFGENRMMVTGAHDLTVHGTASMLVEGDYNTTVRGNHNTTIDGDMNITAKNMNATVRGNIEMAGKSLSMKVEGSSMITSQGNMYLGSSGDMMLGSTEGSVGIGGAKDVGIRAVGGQLALQSEGAMDMKADSGAMNLQTSAKFSIKAGGFVAADGSKIHLNSGESSSAAAAMDVLQASAASKPTEEVSDFGGGMGTPTSVA